MGPYWLQSVHPSAFGNYNFPCLPSEGAECDAGTDRTVQPTGPGWNPGCTQYSEPCWSSHQVSTRQSQALPCHPFSLTNFAIIFIILITTLWSDWGRGWLISSNTITGKLRIFFQLNDTRSLEQYFFCVLNISLLRASLCVNNKIMKTTVMHIRYSLCARLHPKRFNKLLH